MLTHSYYEEDPRVRREAEAVVASGRPVDVFALRRPDDPPDEILDGVTVRRLDVAAPPGRRPRDATSANTSPSSSGPAWALTRAHPRRRYGLVQVHTLPDFLVFAALPLRLVGVPVILDLHEAMPEFFRSRFRGRAGRVGYALLRLQERAATAFASAVAHRERRAWRSAARARRAGRQGDA